MAAVPEVQEAVHPGQVQALVQVHQDQGLPEASAAWEEAEAEVPR